METSHRFLPERKNRGSRMSELAKDEGKMLEDDKDEIFKEDSNDDDFNPDDIKKEDLYSSSNFENEEEEDEEGEEGEDEEGEEESNEEESEQIKKKEKKDKKKEEEILDIEQLDIDKIDMIEDLRDKGVDIDDEEELEKRMREYNEESEYEEDEKIEKKKDGRKKKELKKRGRKKKQEKTDDNIFLNEAIPETNTDQIKNDESNNNDNTAEFRNGKIIISNPEFDDNNINNNLELEEKESQRNIEEESDFDKSSKSKTKGLKKNKKEKNKIKININPETNEAELLNSNVTVDENLNIIINKNCLTEILFPMNHPNLEYIEINKNVDTGMNIGKTRKKTDNKNIISINYHSIVINKNIDKDFMPKEETKKKSNNKIIDDESSIENSNSNVNIKNVNNNVNNNNELLGHKRARTVNNLIELFKKQKKAKINKNVTIIGSRDNPKYIYISKKIYDENDEEKEIQKEEKKKKKKDKEKIKDIEKENEIITFDLEQEADTKNIIKKYKQQEKDKKQFGIQNKVISQEQRLLESIFTELTNKQSLKSMQKLEDLNKREYITTSRKILKDSIRIINSERHILEEEKEKLNNKNNNSNKKQVIEVKITNNKITDVKNEEKPKEENIEKEKEKEEKPKCEDIEIDKENKLNEEKEMDIEENKKEEESENKEEMINEEDKEKLKEKEKELKEKQEKELKEKEEKEKEEENKKLMEEYKQREKKLNKMTVTFTNKEYFRTIFAQMNKKPVKDKKEKICIITGKPAKYFDPLTKNYYSTIEAFKILRERYFQKEEDCLLFKIQTLSDLASQKKERLKKMIMQESENNKVQTELSLNSSNNNLASNKKNNSIRIDSETMTVEDQEETGSKTGINSTLLKMISKFGLLRKETGGEEKKVISHRIYNRNRENCVESGMLLEANKIKLIISKKIFKDKYSSKLPSTTEVNSTTINNNTNEKNEKSG